MLSEIRLITPTSYFTGLIKQFINYILVYHDTKNCFSKHIKQKCKNNFCVRIKVTQKFLFFRKLCKGPYTHRRFFIIYFLKLRLPEMRGRESFWTKILQYTKVILIRYQNNDIPHSDNALSSLTTDLNCRCYYLKHVN